MTSDVDPSAGRDESSLEFGEVGRCPLQSLHANVDLPSGQFLKPIGVGKEPFRKPDSADASLGAVGVTERDEVGDQHVAIVWGIFPPSSMGFSSPFETTAVGGNIRRMATLDRDKLSAAIKAKETTPRAVSRKVGNNPYLVRDILSGKSRNPRSDTLAAIAVALDLSLADILTAGAGTIPAPDRRIGGHLLPVRYRVQAGQWREVDLSAQDFPEPGRPVAPDPQFANWAQWLEEVVGDSIDLRIPEGSFAHVVDAIEMGYAPRAGDLVVVERRRDGGSLRERTIKEIVQRPDGKIELWPRSSNPIHRPVILTDGAENAEAIEAEIVGFVIGSYSSFRRGR